MSIVFTTAPVFMVPDAASAGLGFGVVDVVGDVAGEVVLETEGVSGGDLYTLTKPARREPAAEVFQRTGSAKLFAPHPPLEDLVPDSLLFPPLLDASARVYAGQPMPVSPGKKTPLAFYAKKAEVAKPSSAPYAPMAQEIRRLLKERGWLPKELERKARMPKKSTGMLLSGRWLAKKWWRNLAAAFGLAPDYFAGFTRRHGLLNDRSPSSSPSPFRKVGAAIARRRQEMGLTQTELARRARTDHTGVSHLEAGRVSGRSCLPMIERILRVKEGRYSKEADRILSAVPPSQRRMEILRRRQTRWYGRLGALVEMLRKERGWSRTDLVEKSGSSRSAIGKLEIGASPQFDIWPSLERAFNKPPGFFRRKVQRWGLPATPAESEGWRRQPVRWGSQKRLAMAVRRLRWREGWMQGELARRLEVTPWWVGALERGILRAEAYLPHLAKIFRKRPDYFRRLLKN